MAGTYPLSLLLLVACTLVPPLPSGWAAREGATTQPVVVKGSEPTVGQVVPSERGLSAESARGFLPALAGRRGRALKRSPLSRAAASGPSPYDIPCNRTGSRVSCVFCNYDYVPLQNVRLFYATESNTDQAVFDGTNRKGVRANGFLDSYVGAGGCTTFSYNSAKNLVPLYIDQSSCSFFNPGPAATIGGPLGATYFGYCWATKQTASLTVNITDPFANAITCDVACRLLNFGPAVVNPTFKNPTTFFFAIHNLFGKLKFNQTETSDYKYSLGYKVGFGESALFGFSYAPRDLSPPMAPLQRAAVVAKGRSGPSNTVPCTKAGNKYTCQFCNDDTITLQNIGMTLGPGQTFDGRERKNINKDGDLTAFLNPGECVTFSFTSASTLNFSYVDENKCSTSPAGVKGTISNSGSSFQDFTYVTDVCYPTTQIFDPSKEAPLGCQLKCRPYNFFRDLSNPLFPCDQNGFPNDPGFVPSIFATTGKVTVVEVGRSEPPNCQLNRKLRFGESDPFTYTYYYRDPPPA